VLTPAAGLQNYTFMLVLKVDTKPVLPPPAAAAAPRKGSGK
jgi:hypothetical protein